MNYAQLITETEAELRQFEKRTVLALERDRVRFLRLLKIGQATSQTTAGQLIGLGQRQAQRLWQLYRKAGLSALLMPPSRRGWGKLSSHQISCLRQFLQDDQAQTLAHIQDYLLGSLGVKYSISGISSLCQRLKIKPKTGRPVNVRQAPDAVESFKKV